MMPLTMIRPGDGGTIRRVLGQTEVRRHLAEMGFVEGETVTVVSAFSGNLILQVKGSRVALDHSMAGKIMVEPA